MTERRCRARSFPRRTAASGRPLSLQTRTRRAASFGDKAGRRHTDDEMPFHTLRPFAERDAPFLARGVKNRIVQDGSRRFFIGCEAAQYVADLVRRPDVDGAMLGA